MKNYFSVVSVIFVLSLSGCTQQIKPSLRTYLGSDRVYTKNYSVGQKQVAYVGESIVKVKDYKVKKYSSKTMRASDDFVISGGIVTIAGDRNTDYVVRGSTTLNSNEYSVLNIPASHSVLGVLINKDGTVHNKVLNGDIVLIYDFKSEPENLTFSPGKDEEIDINSGYLNYELVYGGTDGKSINIAYREYTAEDLARPAFYQNLVYDSNQKQIRFRGTVLSVHEATNEKFVFTVISDGLGE